MDVLRCYVYLCTTKIGVCWLWTSNFGIDVVLLVIMLVGVLRLRLEVGNSFSLGSILWKQVQSCQTCSPVMMAQATRAFVFVNGEQYGFSESEKLY